ncbi:hypothetical protein R3W88_005348 [Solanum pinnatisectum]|uniref:C2 domain-containing protein n=1 Tax=Solanum pinnatisectum TaxID=50273 RepID=A0AAV9KDY9_9SOLN|nr:hypothetical protein R3W88_005348 [Solanum pinnatisectum]
MPESHLRRRRSPPEEPLREIEVLIYSAEGLKNVKHLTRMRTYADVYVEKDVHVAKTKVAEHTGHGDDGTNPIWNQVVKVKFHEKLPENDIMAALNVDIYAHGHIREKPVGSARVLLSDVLKDTKSPESEMLENNPIQFMTVLVWRPSGRPQGVLNLWVPPTGRFLVPLNSLSFSLRGRDGEEDQVVTLETPAAESSSEV